MAAVREPRRWATLSPRPDSKGARMNAAPPDDRPVTDRLARAERQIVRLRMTAAFLAIAVALALVWHLAPRELSATHRFELRDGRWSPRGTLELREDGSPALRLDNPRGRVAAMLNVRNDGAVVLRLVDLNGENRARLALGSDGAPALVLSDAGGRTLVRIG